ncbi:MAG: hypothetical protein WB608_07290 [Terracidiphilus sp.]
MTSEHRARWKVEIQKQKGPLKKPADLIRRAVSSEDFVDSAVIGGVSVADILAGRVAEWQIPSSVLEAFHDQYPQYGTGFVEAVNHFHGDPERLMGLVNGVKGKLFELDYVAWLNHGNLPDGLTAELAHSATNPGWDIAIHDAHGHVSELLQMKATDSISYVHEAIATHPDIPVVVPHELYEKMAENHDAFAHILDGHEALNNLNGHITDAVGHAETAGAAEHFPTIGPVVVIGLAVALNYRRYRRGRMTLSDLMRNVGERGALAVLASGAGWAAALLAHEPFFGLPTSIAVRLFGGQLFHNRRRRELLAGLVDAVSDSRRQLENQIQRPLLAAVTD